MDTLDLEAIIKGFAERHHMTCRGNGFCRHFELHNEKDPIHFVMVHCECGVLVVETYLAYPINPTLKNLRWVNRLNASLPNVRLSIDASLKFTESVRLSDVDLTSEEVLEGLILGGTLWMMFNGKAIGDFLLGKATEAESYKAIAG